MAVLTAQMDAGVCRSQTGCNPYQIFLTAIAGWAGLMTAKPDLKLGYKTMAYRRGLSLMTIPLEPSRAKRSVGWDLC